MSTKVTTGVVRASFVHVFEPQPGDEPGSKAKYSITLLIPKSDTKTLEALYAAENVAKEAGKNTKFEGRIPGNLTTIIRDGDESWGTGDAVVIAPGLIHVIDLKYGTGVEVYAEDNPQLKLYGVAALDTFDIIGEVEDVCLTIYQPRRSHVDYFCLSAADLRAWRDSIIPVAQAALQGGAEFGPSEEACRWCPVAGECSARARFVATRDFGEPALLSAEQLAEAKSQIANIRKWCDQVEERALSKAYRDGVKIPGYKVVRSNGRRTVVDPPHAIQVLIDNGFTAEQVAKVSIRSFEDLERLLPKDELHALLGDLIQKTEGKPTLVPENDKREAINALTEESKAFGVIES